MRLRVDEFRELERKSALPTALNQYVGIFATLYSNTKRIVLYNW